MSTTHSPVRAFTKGSGTVDAIDLTSAASTLIYDLTFGGSYIVPVLGFRIQVLDADSVTDPAVISIGTNSSDYDDIVKVQAVPGIVGWSYQKFFDNPVYFPDDIDIYVKVVVPGAGNSFTAAIHVYSSEYQT